MSEPFIPTCPSCSYELRGRPLRGTCPQCRNEYSLSLPGLEPGSIPRSSRYERSSAYDADIARRSLIKSIALIVISLGVISAWKAAEAKDDGAQEAANFLIRYGIAYAASLALYIGCCAMSIIEFAGPLYRASLGVAAALAAALLAQHLGAETLIVGGVPVLGIPWLLGLVVFLGLSADLLELDITEAAILSILVLGLRLMLKFTLFDHMFTS